MTANSNNFIFDYHNGVYGWNESSARGADTFHPFDPRTFIVKNGEVQSITGLTIKTSAMSYDSTNKLLVPTENYYNSGVGVIGDMSNYSVIKAVVGTPAYVTSVGDVLRFYANATDRPIQGTHLSSSNLVCAIGSYSNLWLGVANTHAGGGGISDMWLE